VRKGGGVKFCMRVGLLSGQFFSPFGELWLAGSHGVGGITSGMNLRRILCVGAWHGHSEFGAAALLKAVWWDLRLACLLTHLFVCLFVRMIPSERLNTG